MHEGVDQGAADGEIGNRPRRQGQHAAEHVMRRKGRIADQQLVQQGDESQFERHRGNPIEQGSRGDLAVR